MWSDWVVGKIFQWCKWSITSGYYSTSCFLRDVDEWNILGPMKFVYIKQLIPLFERNVFTGKQIYISRNYISQTSRWHCLYKTDFESTWDPSSELYIYILYTYVRKHSPAYVGPHYNQVKSENRTKRRRHHVLVTCSLKSNLPVPSASGFDAITATWSHALYAMQANVRAH